MAGLTSEDVAKPTEIAHKASSGSQPCLGRRELHLSQALGTLHAMVSTPLETTIRTTAGVSHCD